jgi:hypothetical protein
MPSGKNWFNFLYINVAFVLYILGVFYYSKIVEIKENWPLYRCNPMYMPLADNVNENFVYCIQTMQTSYMDYLLQPMFFIVTTLGDTIGSLVGQINSVRAMFDKIRIFVPNIFSSIFGSFSTLVIEFEKISIGIRDMLGKITGVMISIIYILDGSIKTMTSGYNFVAKIGKCFHPETLIQLQNEKVKFMKDLDLGDVLKNGAVVESVMKIGNKNSRIPFYIIKDAGVNGSDIYVTGSHYIYDITTKKYIPVEKYSNASLVTDVTSDWFSCLITSNHTIKIGNETFWDWDDYLIKLV